MNTGSNPFRHMPIILLRFWRWHPKIALRYLPIVKEINQLAKNDDISILEIGSGSLGIAPYIGKPVTGVDIEFTGPAFPLLKQVRADATNIPFKDRSFDIVVSVDMLEHLPFGKRKKAIIETLRVAKRAVFIGLPIGIKAQKQDHELFKRYENIFGEPHPYLKEHVYYGLPQENEVRNMIKNSANISKRKVNIEVKGNINLDIRRFLMWGWMTKNPIVNVIFRKVFLVFIPILRLCNWEPTYRKIFLLHLKESKYK